MFNRVFLQTGGETRAGEFAVAGPDNKDEKTSAIEKGDG